MEVLYYVIYYTLTDIPYIWNTLVTGLTNTSYVWNTRLVQDGSTYKLAVEAYEREKMESIELVGFCENEDHKSGCSPDGLVGKNGMVQFKSPKYSTMFDYFVKNESITDRQFLGRLYFNQVQMEMLITDREWSDYVVFEPELPLVIRRVKADIDIQNDILRKILVAESEVDILMELVENYSK